ncbi:MAG: c-type cytochrome [Gammaproteobacteria bacterium]|nr:MAG: c-type cytochrome [Gammaproteobacteria bacterium]
MKLFTTLSIACGLALSMAASAETIPAEKVKEKAATCAACHGPDGNAGTDAQYPRLAGQYHDYLARALHEYKNGERKNAIMAGFANTLSDAEIDALSRYFGAMPSKLDDLAKYEQGSD